MGPIDLLIANAGVGKPTTLEPMNTADTEQMIRVNLLGVIYSLEAVLPEMLHRGRGHIAAISSVAAFKGLPNESAYCASKAAVNSYLEGLRIQLPGRGVQVSIICPGIVRTPMTEAINAPKPWCLEPDDAARRIVRALRRKRKLYSFPWQTAALVRLTRYIPDWMIAQAQYLHYWPKVDCRERAVKKPFAA